MRARSPASLFARSLPVGACSLLLAGCELLSPPAAPPQTIELPNRGLQRLASLNSITFAFESRPGCKLETATGEAMPEAGWQPLTTNALAGQTFEVTAVRTLRRNKTGPVQSLVMGVQGAGGARWIRNPPTDDDGEAAEAWRCAISVSTRNAFLKPIAHKRVRLALGTARCSHLGLVLGDPEDLSVVPYDAADGVAFVPPTVPVLGAKNGDTGMFMGVPLKAIKGDAQLTVSSQDFDACFEPADDADPAVADDARSIARWFAGQPFDPTGAPGAAIAALPMATGVHLETCEHDGDGPAEHFECVVSSLRVTPVSGGGTADGTVEVARERTLDAVHTYGGKLVSPIDVVTRDVLVRTHAGGGLAAQLSKPLDASVFDPRKQAARGALGWRLLRPQDVTASAQPTHTLDVEVTYTVPAVETVQVTKQRRVGGSDVPNPDLDVATQTTERLRAELANVTQLGPLGTPERLKVLQQRLDDAKSKADALPKTIAAGDAQTFAWSGSVQRRRGSASLKVSLRAADGSPGLTGTFDLPFEAFDTDDVADPAHGIVAKPARAPTSQDADRALADALVAKIDDIVAEWLLLTHLGATPPATMQPGSRAWAVAAARRAANDRPVALITDWLETRPQQLSTPALVIPVTLPAGAEKRCFVYTAVPLDPSGDANLAFGAAPAQASDPFVAFGRDARQGHEAAFQLCGVPAGRYVLRVSAGLLSDKPGFLVSVFDATPGIGGDELLKAALAGTPSTASGDEPPVLNVAARP